MSQEKKCSHFFHWIIIFILTFVCFGSISVNIILLFLLAKSSTKSFVKFAHPVDEYPKLKEIWSYGNGKFKAVRIQIKGVIERKEENFFTKRDNVDEIIAQIQSAINDKDVLAILLEVDSPGGGITPSDEIYQKLMEFKQSAKNRRIVVLMKGLAASGGYYISMAGDYIIAEPTTITGSIGVLIQSINWKKLSEKIGIRDTTIKSGKNKDLLNPFREPTKEQIELLQKIVQTYHERFIKIISKSRKIPIEKLRPICDGRVFSAQEALEKNLIDKIGYFSDAISTLKRMYNLNNIKIIKYKEEISFWEAFLSSKINSFKIIDELKNKLREESFSIKYLFTL